MNADPKAAENLFNETFRRQMDAQVLIFSLREVTEAGFEAAAKALSRRNVALVRELLTAPEHEKLFLFERKELLDRGFDESAAASITSRTLDNSRASVDAASLVFAHSYLDAIASDYLRVTALASPDDWMEDLLAKNVSLRDLLQSGPDSVLAEKLEKHLSDLEFKSLMTKINVLFARCRPPGAWSPMENYAFDADRVRGLDNLRHEIMHGRALGLPIPTIKEDLDYLGRTAWFLMGLVNFRYGLRIDPRTLSRKSTGATGNAGGADQHS